MNEVKQKFRNAIHPWQFSLKFRENLFPTSHPSVGKVNLGANTRFPCVEYALEPNSFPKSRLEFYDGLLFHNLSYVIYIINCSSFLISSFLPSQTGRWVSVSSVPTNKELSCGIIYIIDSLHHLITDQQIDIVNRIRNYLGVY